MSDEISAQFPEKLEARLADIIDAAPQRKRICTMLVQHVRSRMRLSPELRQASEATILDLCVEIASMGLDPSLPNEVWITAFKSRTGQITVTKMLGYAGVRKLALRNPDVADIIVAAVHEHDEYESPEGAVGLPRHRRPKGFGKRGRPIGYYAAALMRQGHWRTIEMSREEVMEHRNTYVRGSEGSQFWADGKPDSEGLSNFDKKGLITVLRQLCSTRNLSLYAAAEPEEIGAPTASYVPDFTDMVGSASDTIARGNAALADVFGAGPSADAQAAEFATRDELAQQIVHLLHEWYPDDAEQRLSNIIHTAGVRELADLSIPNLQDIIRNIE